MTPAPAARITGRPLLHGRVQPQTFGGPQPPVEYHGGPLMISSKLYLIFWGPKGSFPSSYTAPIIQYAKDLQAEDAHTTDEFSVAKQYANAKSEHITGEVTFGGEDVDTTVYPARGEEGCAKGDEHCVSDAEIQEEILMQIKANEVEGWSMDPAPEPTAQYLVYTPPGVSDCFKEKGFPSECSNVAFCAYHAQVERTVGSENRVATYSALPDAPSCDSGQAPTGVNGEKDADGTLDSEIHELVESATDPAPESGYTDEHGEEVADKCSELTAPAEIYGAPLGGSLALDTAFNQLINGHSYYTQEIWSLASTQTPVPATAGEPAGCVARTGPTPSFTAPATGQTGIAVEFNGSSSYDISSSIEKYEWNFGDGSPTDTTSVPSASHYYVQPGTHPVSLTVSDSSGSADASTQTLPITINGTAVALPTASITAPANRQTYTLGETVATSFSCQEAAGGPGLESCTDSNGSVSPGKLDTSTVGAHSYTVTAVSKDGQRGAETIEYTVASPSPIRGNPGASGSTANNNTGSSSGTGASSSTATASGSSNSGANSTAGTSSSLTGGAKTLTNAQKLARAIKACKKLKRGKRKMCEAQAMKRYAPRHKKHRSKRKA